VLKDKIAKEILIAEKKQITTRLWRDKRNLIFKNNSDKVVPNLLAEMLHCIIFLRTRNSDDHVVDTLKKCNVLQSNDSSYS
jgi:hypothetical protein